jgi:hypothetical protein
MPCNQRQGVIEIGPQAAGRSLKMLHKDRKNPNLEDEAILK